MNRYAGFLILLLPFFSTAQITPHTTAEIKELNYYVQFTNESIHGLLIVHRLLENFNQKVNKYVDLESNQFNFYNNADLPENIFEDPEDWFYDQSPVEWYEKIKAGPSSLPSNIVSGLNRDLDDMKNIINGVNAIRFELDALTRSDDLKARKNLQAIYEKLEECVRLYEDFNQVKRDLKKKIEQRYLGFKVPIGEELGNIIAIHENIRAFLEGVRAEDHSNLAALSRHLKNNLATAKRFNIKSISIQNALQKAEIFTQVADKFISGVGIPPEYRLYGATYYYYNVEMVAKFNRYGSGLVSDINSWIEDEPFSGLLQMEEPHFFKVIYPKREIPKVAVIEQKAPPRIPESVRDRAVVVKQKQINVSPGTITIEVYDHQLQDGDIISLNYNGHWILEEYPLRRKAKKMSLPLKPSNDNYLILHAVNMGDKPPNTATLSYIYKGEKKSIVMESDMNESEMIRINIIR